jgi:hypothetical protein
MTKKFFDIFNVDKPTPAATYNTKATDNTDPEDPVISSSTIKCIDLMHEIWDLGILLSGPAYPVLKATIQLRFLKFFFYFIVISKNCFSEIKLWI